VVAATTITDTKSVSESATDHCCRCSILNTRKPTLCKPCVIKACEHCTINDVDNGFAYCDECWDSFDVCQNGNCPETAVPHNGVDNPSLCEDCYNKQPPCVVCGERHFITNQLTSLCGNCKLPPCKWCGDTVFPDYGGSERGECGDCEWRPKCRLCGLMENDMGAANPLPDRACKCSYAARNSRCGTCLALKNPAELIQGHCIPCHNGNGCMACSKSLLVHSGRSSINQMCNSCFNSMSRCECGNLLVNSASISMKKCLPCIKKTSAKE
jgi:hypothetical protein